MDLLFSGVTIVTMDEAMHVLFGGYLGVTGTKISYISKDPPSQAPEKIMDATGMVLMPGLINCHTHLAMSLLRGCAEDCCLSRWLSDYVLPREDRLDARAARAGVMLSLAECLQFGVTSVSDLYSFPEVTAQAVAEVGMKANIAPALTLFADESEDFDFEKDPACHRLQELVEQWHGHDAGRIRIDAGIHAPYTSHYKLWEPLSAYAKEMGLRMQVHLSETVGEERECQERCGLTSTQLLDCHRVFDVPAAAAHCNHLSREDMGLLARQGISAVHCPVSNLKLVSGVAPVADMVKAGMNVALGTDSAACNNNLDLFEEMKTAALLAKLKAENPAALPPQALVMMATVCGARAQGREAECGMLKVGMDADLILVDFTAPHLMPCHDVWSSLVYGVRGSDVALTMVRGKILYAGGKFTTIDLDGVVREMRDYAMDRVFSPQPEGTVTSADSAFGSGES
ncbi:amidohydrolase family protein [Firmicutes bacterium CAG:137]|mgnify:FL=1|jgi:5-methylthioadenosine/S-adenosylhomocysteine deaminase|nr:amidohydrolase family protein [Firmicutes bacterium CAG:137]